MPRRIQIRSKLAGALAVPLVALVAVAGYEVVQADRRADEAAEQTGLAAAAVGPGSLVSQLQNERNFVAVELIGMTDAVTLPVSSTEEARVASDAALAELRAFVASQGPAAEAAFAEGLATVESDLAEIRTDVDAHDGPKDLENSKLADEVFGRYTEAIHALLDGTAGIALRMDDADLRTGVELVDLATRLYELRAETIREAIARTLAGDVTGATRIGIAERLHEADRLEEAIRLRAAGTYAGVADEGLDDPNVVEQERLLREFADSGELDVTALLRTVRSDSSRGVPLVRALAAERLLDEAREVRSAADARRDTVLLLGSLTLVLALGILAAVNRSITRPLQSLTEQAERMATATLPGAVQQVLETPLGEDVEIPTVEPIEVRTRDEVADVAAALNVVQQSALDLAVEQAALRRNIADSFVNLGRRNQNLLDRQLDFITELERDETDPDRLASLFRLDHLATRMRRNAESLLRLAGGEPQRRWSSPVELGDVVRGALGEVEDYQRVQVRALDRAVVAGSVGADLAHALAELLENALTFSPPDEPVEVRGRLTGDGYVLAVADGGMGMTPEELAAANRRLAGEESFTVAPSRYLGHYVAGHLASRLGIRISLHPGPATGVVARVELPRSLLLDVPAAAAAGAAAPLPSAADATPAAAGPEHAAGTEVGAAATEVPGAAEASPAGPTAGDEAPAPRPVETTASGLVKRVPGAQHPTTSLAARRAAAAEPAEHTEPNGSTEPAEPAGQGDGDGRQEGSSASAVSSFLSDFSAGVARGIAEAGRDPWEGNG